ncbi:MAG: PPC domain-containing DNA-binding protein [Candidatus Micrarchaeota archaeon]
MEYKRNEQRILVRLDPGDEIISSLKEVAKAEGVEGAFVNGIGAARKAELAHYDTKAKKYNTKKFEGMLEIISLSGNLALLENEPVAHLHIAISMHDFSTVSGHLMSAEIYPTCEIVIVPYGIRIDRRHDEKTGLNLQRF